MEPRIKSPAVLLPDVLPSLLALNTAVRKSGLPETISALVHLRVSQVNGCGVCVDIGWRQLKKLGEPDARIFTVAAWREGPYFSDAERAALALAEAATRIADRAEPVPDDVWNEAARHFSEKELAGLTLSIAVTNTFNRLNAVTRQVGGEWTQAIVEPQKVESKRAEEHAVAV